MYFLTLVFVLVLLPGVYTLQCQTCTQASTQACDAQVLECPVQGQQCGTMRMVSYAGIEPPSEVIEKWCFSPDQCVEASVNFGISRTYIRTKCCSTDLCNAGSFSGSVIESRPNGKKCFTCIGSDCTETLDCLGAEDYCISATEITGSGTFTMKGCASEQICSNRPDILGSIGVGISCCKGNLCNSAAGSFSGSVIESRPNGKKCFTCIGSDCTETLDCLGTEDYCISATEKIGSETITVKGCASEQICSNHPDILGSIGVEISCCKGNLCNSAAGSFSGKSPPGSVIKSRPNGKKCFTCIGSDCTETLDCQGAEDYCISSKEKIGSETITMKGCASEQICSNHEQIPGSFGLGISCCKGDLCNSASSAGVLLPLLLAPLLTSVVF